MIEALREVIGIPPAGLEFMEYFFSFIVVLFMFCGLIYIVKLLVSFIKP